MVLGGAGLAALAGCAANTSSTAPATSSSTAAGTTAAGSTATAAAARDVAGIPEETAGPYPGDGSNGPNVLTESGVVRGDIRSSFGSSTTTAEGVPLTIQLTLVEADGDIPVEGAASGHLRHGVRDQRLRAERPQPGADRAHPGQRLGDDGGVSQLATMTGDVAGGYTAALTVGP